MAIEVTRICDSCGNTVEKSEQFWKIGITARHISGAISESGEVHSAMTLFTNERAPQALQVCRTCLEKRFGIYYQPSKERLIEDKPTLEEALTNLMEDLGFVREQ